MKLSNDEKLKIKKMVNELQYLYVSYPVPVRDKHRELFREIKKLIKRLKEAQLEWNDWTPGRRIPDTIWW